MQNKWVCVCNALLSKTPQFDWTNFGVFTVLAMESWKPEQQCVVTQRLLVLINPIHANFTASVIYI